MVTKTHYYPILLTILISSVAHADVAPNPIVAKGIYTNDSCKVRMVSELVKADLYYDSSFVECTFEMLNFGDSTTIEVGFPEMSFEYWSMGDYKQNDKTKFHIAVNGKLLSEKEIAVPKEMQSIYERFMYIHFIEREYKRKTDSIYTANGVTLKKNSALYSSEASMKRTMAALDDLYKWRRSLPFMGSNLNDSISEQRKKGNFPWYVWKVHFGKGERKTIKVNYSLPAGVGYRDANRYFKYILNTGAGWYDTIEKATVILNLYGLDPKKFVEISPEGYAIDYSKNTIEWIFKNLEPTEKDNVLIKY